MGSPMGSMPNLPMLTESLLSEGAPSVPAKVPPQRIALLDNAKAALIYCVVLYHIAVVYTGADRPESPLPYASGFLMLLKPVVMPGFCLISGHVSRATLLPKHTRGLYQLVATYVLFQTLFYLNDMWSFRLNGFAFPTLPVQLFAPPRPAVTWFLVAIVLWRMTLPGFVLMRRPLAFSLLLGLGSLSMDVGLNYQNLLSFLPYFIGGHLLPASAWDVLGRRVLRRSLAASFVGTTLSLLLFSAYGGQHFEHAFLASCVNYGCFTGALPNTSEGCANTTQLLLRIVFYVASVPLLAGFFCVLPRRGGFWSYPGYMSMYIYLLHPLIISNPLIMRASFDWLTLAYGRKTNVWDPATAPSAVAIMPCAALLVTLLLSLPPTRSLFRMAVEPKLAWLFAPGSSSGSGSGALVRPVATPQQ